MTAGPRFLSCGVIVTQAELEASTKIVETELRRIRDATGMRDIVVTANQRDVYWYAAANCGTCAVRDTLAEAINSVEVQKRKAAAK